MLFVVAFPLANLKKLPFCCASGSKKKIVDAFVD